MNRAHSATFAFAVAIAILPSLFPIQAAELRLTLANDPISGNARADDLYTSETAVELLVRDQRLVFTERMFTNRERGLRFDESRASVTFVPIDIAGWTTTPEVGLLHVGEGLLGESVQNRVHRAVGSEEVHLPYIDEASVYPTGAVSLQRQLGSFGSMPLLADIRIETAPGFHSSLEARAGIVRAMGMGLAVELRAGLRADYVESPWLDDVISDAGVTADLVIAWRGVALSFSHNRYGTKSNHLTLGWRAALDGIR